MQISAFAAAMSVEKYTWACSAIRYISCHQFTIQGSIQYHVTAFTQTCDIRGYVNIRYNPNALCLSAIRVKNAKTCEHRTSILR